MSRFKVRPDTNIAQMMRSIGLILIFQRGVPDADSKDHAICKPALPESLSMVWHIIKWPAGVSLVLSEEEKTRCHRIYLWKQSLSVCTMLFEQLSHCLPKAYDALQCRTSGSGDPSFR